MNRSNMNRILFVIIVINAITLVTQLVDWHQTENNLEKARSYMGGE